MKIRWMTMAALFLLIGACSTQQKMPPADDMTQQVFTARCSACHALPHPGRHTAAQWQHVVALMERRMQERQYSPLSEEERRRILAYLTEHAR